MGHGVPAALIASMVKVSVLSSAEQGGMPSAIIHSLNRMLCKEAPGQYATAVYISMNRAGGLGRYCSAGHPAPLLWRYGTGQIEALNVSGLLLGVHSEAEYLEGEFQFEPGDRLLVYSDGLTEAENGRGIGFGDARLPFVLGQHRDLSAEQFAGGLLEDVLDWCAKGTGRGQEDDITFVIVDIT
jgi:serine phosphatase RsbU (regulator of sigma subunit)